MTLPASCRSKQPERGRIVPTLALSGAEQMALDSVLLEHCWAEGQRTPVLRFYRWNRPTLSLGRHQRDMPEHWLRLAGEGHLDLIRRPSGGSAVLHAGGLTYALIWPDPPRQRREAYRQVNRLISGGFERLGVSLRAGTTPANAGVVDCFARSTEADLVDDDETKRIGSAQFWQRGHLLQHGEIPLNPPSALWHAVFGTPPPRWTPAAPAAAAVEQALTASFRDEWSGLIWSTEPLSDEERTSLQHHASAYQLGGPVL